MWHPPQPHGNQNHNTAMLHLVEAPSSNVRFPVANLPSARNLLPESGNKWHFCFTTVTVPTVSSLMHGRFGKGITTTQKNAKISWFWNHLTFSDQLSRSRLISDNCSAYESWKPTQLTREKTKQKCTAQTVSPWRDWSKSCAANGFHAPRNSNDGNHTW